MKKILLILAAGVILGGCNLTPQKSGVEIMAYPTAKVFIDAKEAGMTPYKNMMLKPGEVEIRLVINEREWKKKIELANNVNTVIDWEFGEDENESGGYILQMEKTGDKQKAGIMVNGIPDKCSVAIDGEIKGFSPLRIDQIGEGDKQVTVSFPGRKTINMFVKAANGYQLIVETKLLREEVVKVVEEKSLAMEIKEAMGEEKEKVTIKQTETGWLRVREASGSGSREVTKVNPGEEYELLEEGGGWYKIDLGEGKNGWISAKYADKLL